MVSSNTDYVDFLIILHMVNKTFGDLARQKNSYRQMLMYRTPMGEVGIIQKVKSTSQSPGMPIKEKKGIKYYSNVKPRVR